jgi:hypothetical protein
MSIKFYQVTLRRDGVERTVRVPSPTGVQAADAASPLMRPGEEITSIEQVEDDGLQQADALPPKTQAQELAPVTPGMAARSDQTVADEPRGIAMGGRGGEGTELLETGQEEVFSRTEVEEGRIEHNSTAGSPQG